MADLRKQNDIMQNENQALRQQLENVQTNSAQVAALTRENAKLQDQIEKLKTRIENYRQKNEKIRILMENSEVDETVLSSLTSYFE